MPCRYGTPSAGVGNFLVIEAVNFSIDEQIRSPKWKRNRIQKRHQRLDKCVHASIILRIQMGQHTRITLDGRFGTDIIFGG